jgi:hypothetical protein
MDNFNLQKFLIENKMTRNSVLLSENRDILKNIFTQYAEETLRDTVSEFEDEDEKDQVQQVINGARYNDEDQLINSIYNVEEVLANIMGHYSSDFTEQTAEQLAKICNDINYPNKFRFLRSFLKRSWDDLDWDDIEQDEEWGDFLEKIGEEDENHEEEKFDFED